MPKQAEIDYPKAIGPAALAHAGRKPFSDPNCGRLLVELGLIVTQLPPPPARVLDLGCGTGWSSAFLARAGYEVVGVDLAPDMIAQARRNSDVANLSFQVGDFEDLPFSDEFDAVVFFGALHHAEDERQALASAFRALKPGGVCITCEPGSGHADAPASRAAVRQYGVTEKEMPPRKIIRLARLVGFAGARIVPDVLDFVAVFCTGATGGWLRQLGRLWKYLRRAPERSGIVVLSKGMC